MAVKKHRPVSPGRRHYVSLDYAALTNKSSKPFKGLTVGLKKSGGRNHDGKMTVRNIGGGHKKKYRIIDFKREIEGTAGVVQTIEYDPNRSAYIALVKYGEEHRYILAPDKLVVGATIVAGKEATPEVGNAMYLSDIPLGATIHAIEMNPGKGAQLARSAGTNATLVGREGKYAIVKLPSGEVRRILVTCKATIGSTSNPDHGLQVMGKAGRNRWKGNRPRVRGVAMNPVDHPMGGGEGKSSGGHPRSRTGVFAKGQKTRNPNKPSNKLIISKRKSKK
jgi:large subunit ribosomal protein L2